MSLEGSSAEIPQEIPGLPAGGAEAAQSFGGTDETVISAASSSALDHVPTIPRSAVAVIENDDNFILEGRPDRPGQLAYAGKVQLFGGHANDAPGEPPEPLDATVMREIGEETTIDTTDLEPEKLWEGEYTGVDRNGAPKVRHVGLFRVMVSTPADEIAMKVPGEVVALPKDIEVVEGDSRLTAFTRLALRHVITGDEIEGDN